MWHNSFILAFAILALSVLVMSQVWFHSRTAAQLAGRYIVAHHDGTAPAQFFAEDLTTTAAKTGLAALNGGLVEGREWAHVHHNDLFWWSIAFAVFIVLFVGASFWIDRVFFLMPRRK